MTAPAGPAVSLQIDSEAGAAYLRLGDGKVARTVEFSEEIYVDLDEFDVVIGVELLDLGTPLPLDELETRFHINAQALGLLKGSIQWGPPRIHATSGTAAPQPQVFASGGVHC